MISLEQLFERLSSVTENNISLASTSGSSYGYGYGYYGGGSTDTTIRVFQGTVCLLKDQHGDNVTTSLSGKLAAVYPNGTNTNTLTLQTDGPTNGKQYAFVPTSWGFAYAIGSTSTYEWDGVGSTIIRLNNTQSGTTFYGPSGGNLYCITSGSDVLGYCTATGGTLKYLSQCISDTSTCSVKITYSYTFTVKQVKPKDTYFKPLYSNGTANTIEDIVTKGTLDSGYTSTEFTEAAAPTKAYFYGATVCGTPTEAQAKATANSNDYVSFYNNVSTFKSSAISSSTKNILYNWHMESPYKPCRGITPMAQQIPTTITGISTYLPLVQNQDTEIAYKYYPLQTTEFYNSKSHIFYICNYDIFYIRIFVVSGSTVITDLKDKYKIKCGDKYYDMYKSDFGDAENYYNSSITKTPTYTIKSDISGDTASKYSSSTTSFYFGVIRQNTGTTMDLTLTLCKADNTEVSTLTGTITRTTNTYYMNYFVFNIGSPKLYIGSDQVKSLYIGSTPVKEVWVGSTQIYP